MNYLRHWSLLEKPFAHDASRRFYVGDPQREVIAGFNYLTSGEQAIAILLSSGGCGVTSLLKQVACTHGLGDCAVEVVMTDGNQTHAAGVAVELAGALGLSMDRSDIEDRIRSTVAVSANEKVKTIWLIDDCQPPAATFAQRLAGDMKMFSVVLAVDTHLQGQLAARLQRNADELEPIQMVLEPLSVGQTIDYVHESLRTAGGSWRCWSDEAMIRLHELGDGRLALMAPMAEQAMSLASHHRMDRVEPAVVEAVQESLCRAA